MSVRVSLITSCFKGLRYLPHYFENVAAQTIFPQIEIVFVHNEPSSEELEITSSFKERYPKQFQHITVSAVESLGASWNRGWQTARGEYITMWNVDDLRVIDSIEKQVKLLDKSPNCAIVYGDFVQVKEYDSKKGEVVKTPDFSVRYFSRSIPQGGAFYMWRKEIHRQTGFFDEQFISGADFYFSVRAILTNQKMCRVDATIGYITEENSGISTQDGGHVAGVERTVIQMRFGIFDKIRSQCLQEAREYDIDHILNFGKWQHLTDYLPAYEKFLNKRSLLYKFGKTRNFLRKTFIKMGVLKYIYRIQKRFIKRDL